MIRKPAVMRSAALAGSLIWVALAACAPHIEDRSLRRKHPEAQWEAEFKRATRFDGGGMFELAERRYRKALRIAETFPEGDDRMIRTRYALADLFTVAERIEEA